MAELRRGSGIPSVVPPCGKGIYHKVTAPYYYYYYYYYYY